MIRILRLRSVKTTVCNFSPYSPTAANHCSPSPCRVRSVTSAFSQSKENTASNSRPCFSRLLLFFVSSHSKTTWACFKYIHYLLKPLFRGDPAFCISETQEEQDRWLIDNRDAINVQIRRGIAHLDRGEGIPEDQLDAYLREQKRSPNKCRGAIFSRRKPRSILLKSGAI
jgi:hypothetical protein